VKGIHRYIIPLILAAMQAPSFSQEQKIDFNVSRPGTGILEEEPGRIRISSSIPLIRISDKAIGEDTFFRIHSEGYTSNYVPGAPETPVRNQLIEFPLNSDPEISIISWREDTVRLPDHGISSLLMPSQLSPTKMTSPDSLPFIFDETAYRNIDYSTREPVVFRPLGSSRGTGVGMITLCPFRYYPDQDMLIILNDLVFEITWPVTAETAYKSARSSLQSDIFDRSLQSLMYSSGPLTIPASSGEPVKYVILSDSIFRDCLQPFIHWKTRKGFEVIELYRGKPEVGQTRDEMKATLKSLYDEATTDDPAPLYLLIAGDIEHIPSSQASGQLTDLYYAEYDGDGDYLPELFYGRFSASDTVEMRILIEKSLQHEQYLFPDATFLNRTVLIAGMDGQYASEWGNGQINYMNRYYLNNEHGNIVHKFLYPESGGLADSIKTVISQGASLVNYTGHGYPDRWDNPRFSKSDITDLQNTDKYPVMIGNGCSTATFDDPACLAEALVRAENKGALAYIGCTNDSYWDEDYYWAVGVGPVTANPLYHETGLGVFDRLYHENDEPMEEWYPALGQVLYAGNLAVMAGNIERAKYYWEIYHLFGDPSLMPYFSVPEQIQARHASYFHINSEEFSVFTEPYVYGAVSYEGDLLGAGYADGTGSLEFDIPRDMNDVDTLRLVLTGQNRIPYRTGIIVLPDSVPYIELQSVTLYDSTGNLNGYADYGETLDLSLELANRGSNSSDSLDMKLIVNDPWVELVDSTGSSGPAAPGSVFQTPVLFSLKLSDSITNDYNVSCRLLIQAGITYTWEQHFKLVVQAPDPVLGHYSVNDRMHGNGNGILDPGEKAHLQVSVLNRGHSATDSLTTTLESLPGKLEIADSVRSSGSLPPSGTVDVAFELTSDSSLEKGTWLKIPVMITSPPYKLFDTIELPVGMILEDFESGSLGTYPWLNDSIYPWEITSGTANEGLNSARSGPCQDYDTSVLTINLTSTADGSISFYYRVSSESGYDYLRFFSNGSQVANWSGEHAWNKFTYSIPAGDHAFQWMYTKDKSLSRGSDAAWIDFIEFPEGSFRQYDPGLMDILSPETGQELPLNEPVRIIVRNYGTSTIDSLQVGYSVNGTLTGKDTIIRTLEALDTLEYTFKQLLQLGKGNNYSVRVYTDFRTDGYRGNDTIVLTYRDENIIDAGVMEITSPDLTDSVFTDSETVAIWIHNKGQYPVAQIPITLNINGTILAQETMPDTIYPSDSLHYTFLSTADLSAYGVYELLIYTAVPGDAIQDNDSIRQQLNHKDPLSVWPSNRMPDNLSVFPNPAAGQFRVRLTDAAAGVLSMEVRNILGKHLRQSTTSHPGGEFSSSLDLEDFPDGIYILKVQSGTRIYSGYMIKVSDSR
jgi:hypothetical protein